MVCYVTGAFGVISRLILGFGITFVLLFIGAKAEPLSDRKHHSRCMEIHTVASEKPDCSGCVLQSLSACAERHQADGARYNCTKFPSEIRSINSSFARQLPSHEEAKAAKCLRELRNEPTQPCLDISLFSSSAHDTFLLNWG